jgi:hypothetical protein
MYERVALMRDVLVFASCRFWPWASKNGNVRVWAANRKQTYVQYKYSIQFSIMFCSTATLHIFLQFYSSTVIDRFEFGMSLSLSIVIEDIDRQTQPTRLSIPGESFIFIRS